MSFNLTSYVPLRRTMRQQHTISVPALILDVEVLAESIFLFFCFTSLLLSR